MTKAVPNTPKGNSRSRLAYHKYEMLPPGRKEANRLLTKMFSW